MDIEEMFNAVREGRVTLEEFESWVLDRETEYQSFCSYERSTYVGE